jgi:hypothetical protein
MVDAAFFIIFFIAFNRYRYSSRMNVNCASGVRLYLWKRALCFVKIAFKLYLT